MVTSKIGFIGTGVMGKPMIRNLLKAGYEVAIDNRTPNRMADLIADGAMAPGSPRAVAQRSDVVISMVMDEADTEQVALGDPDGAIYGMRRGNIFIDMATNSPELAYKLASAFAVHGVTVLDAPVSGGERGAIDGTLTIMVGGTPKAFAEALPIFRAMATGVHRIGDTGAGQIAKACNQLIVASTIEVVAEAFALARAFGVNPAVVRQAMLGGFAGSRVLELHGQRMLDRDFVPGGAMKAHMKDREIIAQACESSGLDLRVATVAFDLIKSIVERGGGDLDHSALYKRFDDIADADNAQPPLD